VPKARSASAAHCVDRPAICVAIAGVYACCQLPGAVPPSATAQAMTCSARAARCAGVAALDTGGEAPTIPELDHSREPNPADGHPSRPRPFPPLTIPELAATPHHPRRTAHHPRGHANGWRHPGNPRGMVDPPTDFLCPPTARLRMVKSICFLRGAEISG
jgi:hypothetical protein